MNKCRNNLHIVLAMSPSGSKLRLRCRNFPGLVSNAVIDWFFPWPADALQKVAEFFLQEVRAHVRPWPGTHPPVHRPSGRLAPLPSRLPASVPPSLRPSVPPCRPAVLPHPTDPIRLLSMSINPTPIRRAAGARSRCQRSPERPSSST